MAGSQFEKTMSELGYVLEERDGLKLTYKKNAKFSDLVLVINLELKYINPILVPSSVILYEKEAIEIVQDFKCLRIDANYISEKSKGVLKVLN